VLDNSPVTHYEARVTSLIESLEETIDQPVAIRLPAECGRTMLLLSSHRGARHTVKLPSYVWNENRNLLPSGVLTHARSDKCTEARYAI
jgi:hypothetical protein